MSIELGLYSENDGRWDKYVSQSPKASFYHQWAYRQIVAQTFGHRPYYLAAFRGEDLEGILPLFVVKSWLFGSFLASLPFVDYGGVCAQEEEIEQALLQEAIWIAEREHIQILELRHRHLTTSDLPTRLNKVNLVLPLDLDPDRIWKGLGAKVRNQVRKAQKSGLTFETGGLGKVADFYRVWSHNMRDLGTPAYPKTFFQNLLHAFPDDSEVLLVRHGQKPVGTGIAVYFKESMEVPLASSLRRYFPYCPNNLLYWEAIKRGCERGCREFHFGRSNKSSGNYYFKRQWGAKEQQLYYQYHVLGEDDMPNLNPRSPKYRLAVTLWKKLPLFMANILGPQIIKYVP